MTARRPGTLGAPNAFSLKEGPMFDRRRRIGPMRRLIITPSSMPLVPTPGPLLEFIQQAQLSLVYARGQ
jgi:hypothetical protein